MSVVISRVGWSARVRDGVVVATLMALGPAGYGSALVIQTKVPPESGLPVCPVSSGGQAGTPSVAHYPRSRAGGLGKPDRIIAGPRTLLCHPRAVALGPKGELYVLGVAWSIVVGRDGLQEW